MRPCVFFDRDGIVNESPGPGYVERWEDFHLLPDFIAILRIVRRLGFAAVVVTNQRGVATGRMTAATVDDIHRRLAAALKAEGLALDDILYCPHDRNACDCRKPKPGLLLEAARRHDLDLGRSWMVGDSATDVEAGRAAGCRTILVAPPAPAIASDLRFDTLAELRSALEEMRIEMTRKDAG